MQKTRKECLSSKQAQTCAKGCEFDHDLENGCTLGVLINQNHLFHSLYVAEFKMYETETNNLAASPENSDRSVRILT